MLRIAMTGSTPLYLLISFVSILLPLIFSASTELEGDYEKNATLSDNADLRFRIDESRGVAHLALTVTDKEKITAGERSYIGLGIGEPSSGSMLGADIVTAEWDDSNGDGDTNCDLKDRFVPFEPYPTAPGESQLFPEEDKCGNSWTLVNCARDAENGKLLLEVRRNLDSNGDTQDRDIGPGQQQIMYAYGQSFQYHGGDSRESVQVVLYGSELANREAPDDLGKSEMLRNEKYTVPSEPTTYSCTGIVANVPEGGKSTIIGAEPMIQEGNEDVVHHFVLYMCSNGPHFKKYQGKTTACLGDSPLGNPKANCAGIAYAWAKGGTRFFFPTVTGLELNDDNKYLILETHFDNPAKERGRVDSSGVRLFYSTGDRKIPGGIMVIGDGLVTFSGQIVRDKDPYMYTCPSNCTGRLKEPVNVFGAGLHMHTTGKEIYTNHYDENGTLKGRRESVAFWSDSFQKFEPLIEEWKIERGDTLTTTCIYDTSKRPETKWGVETKDEMCMHFLWVYPVPKLEGDTQLYVCGGISPTKKRNETLTVCAGASDISKKNILPLQNPTMNDTAGLGNTFPQAPDVCRSADVDEGDSDGDGNNDDGNDDDPECFPGSATVELGSGKIVPMREIAIGDRVKTANGDFSKVYFFSHRDAHATTEFVQLTATSGLVSSEMHTLTASEGHYVYTDRGVLAAKNIKEGDALYNENGEVLTVTKKEMVVTQGLYSPHTMEGSVLVNGVRASTYSEVLPAKVAHLLLLPERLAYRAGFSLYGGQTYVGRKTMGDGGRPLVVEVAHSLLKSVKTAIK